jgi:hypothetical protein
LQAAAPLDADLKALWKEISERRATNMRRFAENLAVTGSMRAGLSIPEAADIIWSLGSPEYYVLLVESRGWALAEFETWLGEAWVRLLLRPG